MSDDTTAESVRPTGVLVGRDGVKLGWNVLAMLATIGLGLYVSNVVTPINNDIAMLKERVADLTVAIDALSAAQSAQLRDSASAHIELKADVKHLAERQIELSRRLEKRLDRTPYSAGDHK